MDMGFQFLIHGDDIFATGSWFMERANMVMKKIVATGVGALLLTAALGATAGAAQASPLEPTIAVAHGDYLKPGSYDQEGGYIQEKEGNCAKEGRNDKDGVHIQLGHEDFKEEITKIFDLFHGSFSADDN
jgi:hypothetical protein